MISNFHAIIFEHHQIFQEVTAPHVEKKGYSLVNAHCLQNMQALSRCCTWLQQQVKSTCWNLFTYAKQQFWNRSFALTAATLTTYCEQYICFKQQRQTVNLLYFFSNCFLQRTMDSCIYRARNSNKSLLDLRGTDILQVRNQFWKVHAVAWGSSIFLLIDSSKSVSSSSV